ncbi:penicillin amidase [Isoptericola sp. CG 20/1183]|uniref:Penicillin amidase n=1 Tax=Isoptericola halotolerans TaxID=300560 RepID=A0ABX5EEH0_9MICO|nr:MULTISPECIES: penicillin acylase family protein [Isoptericola]PRZ07099.1 penicillin amidase [Isoptericola halotolerans]PRZ07229.1 penicillin amidase [Isoptericola sp. CG 20/1183]
MRFETFRDAWGVPHVRAATEPDLAFGQGYVTARDRGWQLESDRWRAEGRLAARIGPGGLAWDRFAVQVRLADTARRVHAALAAPERAWLAAYTAGVNAGLADGGRDVPELDVLASGGAVPGELPPHTPWPDWAPLGVFLTNHVLFSGWPHLLWREHVARTLGPDHVLLGGADGEAGASSGSNAWALAGGRTASGAPLLAGDPHRLLELPGVYQQVRLACDEYDVVGLAFPGVPGVQHFGHATVRDGAPPDGPDGSVAWGITNAMAHHVELFTETADTLSGSAGEVTTVRETVPVRGAEDVEVAWTETPRGPLVTDRHSLRWPARVDADLGVASWRRLLRSRTAGDVAEAFAGWVDPVNRVLTADSAGTVLSLTAGRVPDRAPAERVLPHAVGPGWRPPWRSLPGAVEVHDLAVDANDRPVPGGRAPDLGHAYAPHRARRIAALLATAPDDGERPGGQSRVFGDVSDGGAASLVSLLAGVRGSGVGPAAARLRDWAASGARMDAGSVDAALFVRWRDALARRVSAHPALAPVHAPTGLPALFDPWCDVVARVAGALEPLLRAGATWDPPQDPAAEAEAALAQVTRRAAVGPAGGASNVPVTWGDLHPVLPLHGLAEVTVLDPAGVPRVPDVHRVPVGGAADTVCCTGSVPGVATASWRGSVARWVWDLADRRRSRWGVPFGSSGDPRSPHFTDQHPQWAAAGTHEIETDWARLRPETWETR